MTAAAGGPARAWTTDTIRRVHGWTDPTKPAPIASRTVILQLSTRRVGRSANCVSTTKRASVRVSFIGGGGPPPPPGGLLPPPVPVVQGGGLCPPRAPPAHASDGV